MAGTLRANRGFDPQLHSFFPGSGQIAKLGKPAFRRKRANWKTGKARFQEEAGRLESWENSLPGESGQCGELGTPASRRKRANWDIGNFSEEAGKFNQVVSENSTLVVVNLVGAEKVGSFSLKSVAILR